MKYLQRFACIARKAILPFVIICSLMMPFALAEETEDLQAGWISITQEEAYLLMQSETPCMILDVREQYEYDEGHIAGAVLLPYTSITEETAAELLPNKDQTILVYCRSGRRSKIGAQLLADLGYTDVREFGGIIDWPYGY